MTTSIANETVQQLGLSIGRDEALINSDWQTLWYVFKIEQNDIEEFGRFVREGQEFGFLLDGDQPGNLAIRLRDLMIDDDGKSWIACKVSIIRATRDINIKFEYENEDVWDPPLPF